MEYKTILLHIGNRESVKASVAAAAELVAAQGGHVKAVFVMPPLPQPVEFVFPASDEYLEGLRNEYGRLAETLRDDFFRLADDRHFESEWRLVEGVRTSIAEGIVREARAADIVVLTNRRQSGENIDVRFAPERVILDSGRPVLLLPEKGNVRIAGARVTIAWNNRREAARAVFDALPLLKKAGPIRILTIEDSRRGGDSGGMSGADIAAALSRHGLDVDIDTASGRSSSTGEIILEQLASDGSDILVMGGYGHTRFRELVLGGVTRHVLETAGIPVLMAH